MSTQTTVLTDVDAGVWQDQFSAGAGSWSLRKRTLRGGMSDGVDVVEIDNGALRFSVLPTRGMGLWRGRYRDVDLGWDSPVKRPVHPSYVNAVDRSGLGWLSGFNEWMCRCGLSSHGSPGLDTVTNNQGNKIETPLTLHGKIANLAAHHVEVAHPKGDRGTLSVTGTVDESMLFGPYLQLVSQVTTESGSNRLTILDVVTNRGGHPTELELLYHTNMGRPLLEPGSSFVAPVRSVAPNNARSAEGTSTWSQYEAPVAGYVEQVYFVELADDGKGETLVMLRSAHGERGVSLHFDRRQLPHFTLWKNTQAEADGYVTGLEPGTSLPNLKTFERSQGRVIVLGPGESYTARLDIAVHTTAEEVAAVERRIAELQGGTRPTVHEQPQPTLSPV